MSAKTDSSLEKTEQYTFFQGKKSPFSMQYDTTFVLKGKLFRSVDQYMYYKKAVLFNDVDNAQKILETLQAGEQKKLAGQVKGVDPYRWSKHSPDFLYEAVRAKFVQHANLLEQLIATRGTELVEADPNDKIFGIGMGMSNDEKADPAKWKGTNLLGKMLTHLREDLFSGLEMNKIIAQVMDSSLTGEPFPDSEADWAQRILNRLDATLQTRNNDQPKDRWSFEKNELPVPEEIENSSPAGETLTEDTPETEEDFDFELPARSSGSVNALQPAFFIIHETDFETFKYPITLRILSGANADERKIDPQIAFWNDIELLENAIASKSNGYHKGYHLTITRDPFFPDGDGTEATTLPEKIIPFAVHKAKERVAGTLVLKSDDTEHIVTLRGQYRTDKWTEKEGTFQLIQQILPAQWK